MNSTDADMFLQASSGLPCNQAPYGTLKKEDVLILFYACSSLSLNLVPNQLKGTSVGL